MILSEINQKITDLTGVDTGAYTSASRLVDINIWYQKVVSMILDSQDEADFDDMRQTSYPIITTPLTANRDYNIAQTYNFLKIKDLTVFYDGVTGYRAKPMDDTDYNIGIGTSTSTLQNTKIDSYFSRTNPKYDLKFNSIWLYPIALPADIASSGFMAIEYFRSPVEFTSGDLSTGTASPGFDITFHAMLAYGPALEYCESKTLPQTESVRAKLLEYESRLRQQYGSKQLDRHISLQPDYVDYK